MHFSSLSPRGSVASDVLFLRAKRVCDFCLRGRNNNNYHYYYFKFTFNTVLSWLHSPRGLWPPRYRGFTITLKYNTLTRTPLDE